MKANKMWRDEDKTMLHNNCIPENLIDIVTEWEKNNVRLV